MALLAFHGSTSSLSIVRSLRAVNQWTNAITVWTETHSTVQRGGFRHNAVTDKGFSLLRIFWRFGDNAQTMWAEVIYCLQQEHLWCRRNEEIPQMSHQNPHFPQIVFFHRRSRLSYRISRTLDCWTVSFLLFIQLFCLVPYVRQSNAACPHMWNRNKINSVFSNHLFYFCSKRPHM